MTVDGSEIRITLYNMWNPINSPYINCWFFGIFWGSINSSKSTRVPSSQPGVRQQEAKSQGTPNISDLAWKISHPQKETIVFQPLIFRGELLVAGRKYDFRNRLLKEIYCDIFWECGRFNSSTEKKNMSMHVCIYIYTCIYFLWPNFLVASWPKSNICILVCQKSIPCRVSTPTWKTHEWCHNLLGSF